MAFSRSSSWVLVGILAASAACSSAITPRSDAGTDDVGADGSNASGTTIRVVARANGAAFQCGTVLQNAGTTHAAATITDLRLYVSNVRLLKGDREVAFVLSENAFQNGSVALLDFENGTGVCSHGNNATNAQLVGTPAEPGPYSGLRFEVGVPEDRNYLDNGTQPSPLNLSSMYWGWTAGYKFVRLEGTTPSASDGFALHLGNPICVNRTAPDCIRYLPTITLQGSLSVAGGRLSQAVELELARMLADSDLLQNPPPRCMSDPGDPVCPPMMRPFGLMNGTQSVFALVANP